MLHFGLIARPHVPGYNFRGNAMSEGESPRYAHNAFLGEWRRTHSITYHALSPHPHVIICTSFWRITMSLKWRLVPKSDVNHYLSTTATLATTPTLSKRRFIILGTEIVVSVSVFRPQLIIGLFRLFHAVQHGTETLIVYSNHSWEVASSSVHHSSHQLTTTFLSYYNPGITMSLKRPFVPKSDTKQLFTTTTTTTTTTDVDMVTSLNYRQ